MSAALISALQFRLESANIDAISASLLESFWNLSSLCEVLLSLCEKICGHFAVFVSLESHDLTAVALSESNLMRTTRPKPLEV